MLVEPQTYFKNPIYKIKIRKQKVARNSKDNLIMTSNQLVKSMPQTFSATPQNKFIPKLPLPLIKFDSNTQQVSPKWNSS